MIYRTEIDNKPESIEAASKTTYDEITIRVGTSGLISALTLIEQGKKVALFEEGSFSFFACISNIELRFQREQTDSVLNSFQHTRKLSDKNNFSPNFSCLGGRNLFWNGAPPRFQLHDFNHWPISNDEIVPLYEWAEKEFIVSNSYRQTEQSKKVMFNINEKQKLNSIPAPFASNDTKEHFGMFPFRVSSGLSLFLRRNSIKERKELIDVFLNSFMKKINLSAQTAAGLINLLWEKIFLAKKTHCSAKYAWNIISWLIANGTRREKVQLGD